jgi:membrane associated rhomboid family serine protease
MQSTCKQRQAMVIEHTETGSFYVGQHVTIETSTHSKVWEFIVAICVPLASFIGIFALLPIFIPYIPEQSQIACAFGGFFISACVVYRIKKQHTTLSIKPTSAQCVPLREEEL